MGSLDRLVIHSRKFEVRFLFYRYNMQLGGYIIVNIDYIESGLSCTKQPCHGGGFRGETVSYDGDDQDEFNAICRAWYRAWKRNRDDEVNDHLLPLRRRR